MLNNDVKVTSFEKFLRRDVKILQIIGLHSLADVFTAEVTKPKIWESIAFEIGLLNLGAAVWFETLKVIDVWGQDPEYIIGALSAIVSGSVSFLKACRLWFWREELRTLLHHSATLWKKANLRDSIENQKMAEATCFVTKLHIIMVAILCLSYAVRPYILLLIYQANEKNMNVSYDYTVTVYPASYPWPTGTTIKYIICLSWEQFVIFFVALYWMASDTIFAQLTTHMAIQFRVLWNDLEHITTSDNDQQETNERKLRHRLSTIVKRHCDLYTHCEMIERIFNPIVFLTLSFTAAHMCLCAFHLQKELMYGNWEEVAKSLLHTVTVIIQGFIYCGYSQKLTLQSSRMAEAAYNCSWMDRGKEFKIMLGVIMMRSQKPFVCMAYGFFALNLIQMAAIFKGAGSYFALLQSVT